MFTEQFFKPLDLERAAKAQYGPKASLTSEGEHAYDWRARVGTDLFSLNLDRAAKQQYGPGFTAILRGVHRYDWRAFAPSEPRFLILPVMPVASDLFRMRDEVKDALDRYRSVLAVVFEWYQRRAGCHLRFLEPIVLDSSRTASSWNALSEASTQEKHRFEYLHELVSDYKRFLPEPSPFLRVLLTPFTGKSVQYWHGAASQFPFACAAPRGTSVTCRDLDALSPECRNAAYAAGHELGHVLGVRRHTCEAHPADPNCWNSIMQNGEPPDAILFPEEICRIAASGFLHPVDVIVSPALCSLDALGSKS